LCAGVALWAQPEKHEDPPLLGAHEVKGEGGHGGGGGGGGSSPNSPLLIYRGGTVMHGTASKAIFWGASWANSGFVSDKISGMDLFYSGAGSSSYLGTTTEYTDGSGHVGTAVVYGGHVIDTSAAPSSGSQTAPILAEVCKVITNPVSNGYYPVYVDQPRGNAGFCAWHSWGTCNGVQVQFAFFFNLDGDPGCDPQDTSGLHTQGTAALANVSGHELSEMLTDPRGAGWTDRNGSENADKCAWSFGSLLVPFPNGTQWKIQGNWSNAAFTAGTGYANRSGQKACLDGANYR
jgi:hypothetical protein